MDTHNQFSQRAPALLLLPGLVAGLLLARAVPASPTAALIALALALLSWRLATGHRSALWLITFGASTVLGFWAYGTVRLPASPPPELLAMPPREAVLELKLTRVMQAENRFGSSTGIARVVDTTRTSRLKKGSRVYFRFSPDDTASLDIMRGLTVRATGVVQPIPADVPADSFDAYLRETGVYYKFMQTSRAETIKEASTLSRLSHTTHLQFHNYLRLGEPEARQLSKIYIAMLLGQKTQLTHDQRDRFRVTGTMHLFAISGLHIGVIATVIWQALLLLRVPSKFTPVIGLPLLYFYVEVTGAPPSAIRAFLMVSFFWASMALQRQRSPMAAFAASAVAVLIIQPAQLWQMGFQLSYLVVISILMFGLPFREKIWPLLEPNRFLPQADWTTSQRAAHWIGDKLLLLFAISLSAWLASAPLSAGFFGFIAPYSILVNILLVNLAALVISSGAIALLIASLGLPGLTAFLNHSAWMGISLMDTIVQLNLKLPLATVECPDFPKTVSYLGVLAYSAAILVFNNKTHPLTRFAVPSFIVLATLATGLMLGSF